MGWRAVELVVLCTFAFAQPVFAELDGQFFLAKNLWGADVLVPVLVAVALPPGVLFLIELLAQRAGDRIAQRIHLAIVAVLLTAIASGIVLRTFETRSVVQGALAVAAGVAATVAFARLDPVRSFVRVLAPAPLVFVALFLFTTSVSGVLSPNANPPLQATSIRAPVVMIVFDEFPSTTLMDSRERIDAARFPNFARLAGDATWFRNATTAHAYTEFSVPAIVSGDRSKEDTTTTPADHPTTIYTLLGRTHDIEVAGNEPLCPTRLCPRSVKPIPRRYGPALEDMALTSFRLVLPDALALKLPQPAPAGWIPPKPQMERFTRSIRGGDRPTLYYAHTFIPHAPYAFLPSGKTYPLSVDGKAGFQSFQLWGDNRWQVIQQQQRELLQVAYVDRVLGRVIDRMKQTGLYDRAAIVITADHGVSFRAGDQARIATSGNLEQIMPVPFFLKAPGQREGAIRDDPVQTIDILPTLTGALGARLPWATDGVDALSEPVRRERLTIINRGGERVSIAFRDFLERRRAELRSRIRRFGEGSITRIFGAGPYRELLGRPAPAAREGSAEVRFDEGLEELTSYEPSSEVFPARVVGHVVPSPKDSPVPLAIALNGRIRATTWTYWARGRTSFSAMLPPAAVRPGRNDIRVYAIESGGRLEPLGQ